MSGLKDSSAPIEDLTNALVAVLERWKHEYHCCNGMKYAPRDQVPIHSSDCAYVAGCMLVGLKP